MEWKKSVPMMLSALIVAVGLCVAANTLANRPMQGSLNGSIMTSGGGGGYDYPDVMTTSALLDYLSIYPEVNYNVEYSSGDPTQAPEAYVDPYEQELQRLIKTFEANVTSGRLPAFPFVSIGGKLYYSKAAVDQWFLDMGSQRLIITSDSLLQ